MTPIALLRHFPTQWNRDKRLQGRSDQPLLDTSRQELARLALPEAWSAARIICSPLKRARETAEILSDRAITADARLVEISWGDWEGMLAADLAADPEAEYAPTGDWDEDRRAPNGESHAEAWSRISPALVEIAASPEPAVLVIHKAVMRVILRRAWAPRALGHISSRKLHPLMLDGEGYPCQPGAPMKLVPR